MIGVGRTKLYELISSGELETIKIGKATRITTASLHRLVERHRALN
jgi:excisionase family DNA binding protein